VRRFIRKTVVSKWCRRRSRSINSSSASSATVARSLSGTTLFGYRAIWKRVEPIAGIIVSKHKPAHLSELYGQLARDGWSGGKGPLSVRSIGHTHTLLSTLLAWSVRLELAGRNVADAVQPPKGARKARRAVSARRR